MYNIKKQRFILKINFKKFALISLLSFIFFNPAYAYGGPGVAIGAVIIFFTVILAFFASTFISIFNFLKKLFKSIVQKFKKRNKKKK